MHMCIFYRTERKRNCGCSIFPFFVIFNVSGWQIRGSNTFEKWYDWVSWSFVFLKIRFCVGSKFWMEPKGWPFLSVSNHKSNRLTIYMFECCQIPHTSRVYWNFVLMGHRVCSMQVRQWEWQTYILRFFSPVLLQIPYCLDYCNFIGSSKSGIVSPLILLLLKIVLTATIPMDFLTDFRISLSILTQKASWDLTWNYIEYTD